MQDVVKEINQVIYSCKAYSQAPSEFGKGAKPRGLTSQVNVRSLQADKTDRLIPIGYKYINLREIK